MIELENPEVRIMALEEALDHALMYMYPNCVPAEMEAARVAAWRVLRGYAKDLEEAEQESPKT